MKKRMFNDRYGLTEAVLNSTKTVTRSLITPQPTNSAQYAGMHFITEVVGKKVKKQKLRADFSDNTTATSLFNFYETVAVAQRYSDIFAPDKILYRSVGDGYREERADAQKGWDNKMFVAPNLMPHYIRIDKVRCERLQDISEEDCMKEGVMMGHSNSYAMRKGYSYYIIDKLKNRPCGFGRTPQDTFAVLIDLIMGSGTWNSNPWVWVYEFTLIQ